jgi:hypothetical protein
MNFIKLANVVRRPVKQRNNSVDADSTRSVMNICSCGMQIWSHCGDQWADQYGEFGDFGSLGQDHQHEPSLNAEQIVSQQMNAII